MKDLSHAPPAAPGVTPQQVQRLLKDLLLWRQAEGPIARGGPRIDTVSTSTGGVRVIFDDLSIADLPILITPPPEGGQQ